jgi:hypothetical protein
VNDDDMMPPPDVIEAFMKHCSCCQCCQNPPCDGVMAGGMCDERRCIRDDERDDEYYDDECDEYGEPFTKGHA